MAQILPPLPEQGKSWLGSMRGQGTIHDDLIAPAADAGDWEALLLAERGRLTLEPHLVTADQRLREHGGVPTIW